MADLSSGRAKEVFLLLVTGLPVKGTVWLANVSLGI